jgi:hypothetical protein
MPFSGTFDTSLMYCTLDNAIHAHVIDRNDATPAASYITFSESILSVPLTESISLVAS